MKPTLQRHAMIMRLTIAAFLLPGMTGSVRSEEVTVMTFNVLCSFCDRANYDPWNERLDYMRDIVTRHAPDIIGTQEITKGPEVAELAGHLSGYDTLYYKEDKDGRERDYPDAAIYYRRDMFEVVESGTFWLSDTPDKPWSRGWAKGQFWRIATWAHFKFKTSGRDLFFLTTHFDNNQPNQPKSAPLLLSKVEPWAAKMPCIITGDFNSKPDTPAYATLTRGIDGAGFRLVDARDAAAETLIATNQKPEPEYDPAQRIDHVFTAGPTPMKSLRWTVDMTVYGSQNRYPSDHRAISARIRIE